MKFFDIKDMMNLLKIYNPPTYMTKKERTEEGVDGRIVSYVDKSSYIAEQYKVLRTNLYSLSPGNPIKTIVITSSQAQEGKTITSSNLAVTLSMDREKKVLLIDTDFRRPAIHTAFGIPRKPGFADVLEGKIDIDVFLKKPVLGDLFVIPSGTIQPNPSEIFISSRIKNIMDKLKSMFDYVICDSPPVMNVTDASILGSACDAVLFVVKAGVTQRNIIEEAFNMLAEAQAKPKACILTNVHFVLDSYYYFYRYKYYKYTAAADKKE